MTYRNFTKPLSLLVPIVLACALPWPTQADSSTYQTEVLVDQLDYPWSAAFLPNGDMLLAELSGSLLRITPEQEKFTIEGMPEVYFAGQGGFFDITPHPDFIQNQQVFLSYASGDSAANGTTVAQARLIDDKLTGLEVIWRAIPQKYAPLHYGGRLAWFNGDLLLTTGDGFDYREKAQGTGNAFGKTILLTVAGNNTGPFAEAPDVWSFGHRNPQGLAVAADGTVYQHEHGPKGGDEINIIKPGLNYGWPAVTHGEDYNGAYVSPFKEHPSMENPIHVWVPSIAPSGLMVYEGEMFPEWQGNLFVGALVDQEVRRLELAGGQIKQETAAFPEIAARIRDIRQAPDGAIIVITDGADGKVYRVSR